MNRQRGFNYQHALHVLNPTRAAERDLRRRLAAIAEEIEDIAWRRNAQGKADRMAGLLDERARLRDALARHTARRSPTGKRREADGARP